MNCADVDSALNEHRVSSLGRAERKALDDHVRTCDRCAAALLADEMLRAEPPIDVPAGLLERVRRAVADAGSSSSAGAQAPAAGRPVFRPGRRGALWLGAAAAVALAAMLVVSPPQERETVSSTGSPDPIGMTLAGGQGASRFVEGQHYLRLPVVAAPAQGDVDVDVSSTIDLGRPSDRSGNDVLIRLEGRVVVIEFFMYGCYHCYTFELPFARWSDARAGVADIVRVPVMFNAAARAHAQAFYTAELLGISDRVHDEFFAAIHERGQRLGTEAELREFFSGLGVEESAFTAAFNSDAVLDAMQRAEELGQRYLINATPSLVIGGEYQVTPALVEGSFEEMLAVTDELIERELDEARRCDERAEPRRCTLSPGAVF